MIWSTKRAWEWYRAQGWIRGYCGYPSNCVNRIALWQEYGHEALELSNKAVAEALDGLPAYKMHCSVLAEQAIKAAVKDYYDRNHIPYDSCKFADCDSCPHCHEE